MSLEPDRDQIEIFFDALLRYRGEDGYLSLRAFYHEPKNKPFAKKMWTAKLNGGVFRGLIGRAVDIARRAANDPKPVVFCPPLAVFNAANDWQAREEDLFKGLALSVECDQHPEEARQKLQEILGEATSVVRSGGQWINGDARAEDKLHLHWRLKVPAMGGALSKLKRAREMATHIAGGDPSNVNAVHPIRWPGSWHRKGTPRLCEIITVNADVEIELDAALAALEAAAPELAAHSGTPHEPGEPQACPELVAAALAVIPNQEDWSGWNAIGMAVWRATGGAAAGFAAFDAWSRKSPKYDNGTTAARWAGYFRSPPTHIGAGTIFHRADQASANWRPSPEPPPGLDDAPPSAAEPEPEPERQEPNGRGAQATPSPAPQDDDDLGEWDAGDDPGPIPPREWLLGNQFCRLFISSIVAAGGTGKTALRILQFVSLALGHSLCGQHVFLRSRVLLVSLEDDRWELQRRIEAVLKYYNINRGELKGWLFVATLRGVKLVEINNRKRIVGPLERKLRKAVKRRNPDLVSLDPFVKTHSLEENNNSDMDYVCDLLAQIGADYNVSIDSPHHVHKGTITPGDADSGRGGSGIRDAGRLVYTLCPMSEEDAAAFGIAPDERYDYVRLDRAKVNITARGGKPEWFKIVGVPLDNPTSTYPAGDIIQVATPWQPRSLWSGFDKPIIEAIFDNLRQGPKPGEYYSAQPSAKDRHAWHVVSAQCPTLTEKQCRNVITEWVTNGLLNKFTYTNRNRKTRAGVMVNEAALTKILAAMGATPAESRVGAANNAAPRQRERFKVVGEHGPDVACAQCGGRGNVFKVARNEAGACAEALHRECAPLWFDE